MLVHWIWFSMIPDSFWKERLQLLQYFHDPEEVYYCGERALPKLPDRLREYLEKRDIAPAQEILDRCTGKNVGILTYGDGAYPAKLKNIPDPPFVLYYKGHLPDWESVPVIGIVGTRKASAYGMQSAGLLGGQIAAGGGLVVSGAATGIDTAAMEGALAQDRPVVGVLGCGIDKVYPAENRKLYARTEENGCLLSEYPPGMEARKWQFPRRNRIISGLSNGLLVVEAPKVSGALITARQAWEQGRDVFAVPGNIGVDTCEGSNELLRERAVPVCTGWDVLREYESLYPGKVKRQDDVVPIRTEPESVSRQETQGAKERKDDRKSIDNSPKSKYIDRESLFSDLSPEELAVVRCLGDDPRTMDDIIAQASLPAGKVMTILTKLSIKGLIRNHPGRMVSLNLQ